MRITVDVHEPSSLMQGLLGLGVQVEQRHLDSGDVVIDHDGLYIAAELKRGQDFQNSLHSGRLHSQLCRMREAYRYSVLIIEAWEGEDVEQHLQQVETLNLRVPTYKMRDTGETVRFVDKLCRLIKEKKLLMLKRPVIVEPDPDLRIQLLSSLPNINKARATEILTKYGCLQDAFTHIEEWGEFNGITEDRLALIIKVWKHIGEWSYADQRGN